MATFARAIQGLEPGEIEEGTADTPVECTCFALIDDCIEIRSKKCKAREHVCICDDLKDDDITKNKIVCRCKPPHSHFDNRHGDIFQSRLSAIRTERVALRNKAKSALKNAMKNVKQTQTAKSAQTAQTAKTTKRVAYTHRCTQKRKEELSKRRFRNNGNSTQTIKLRRRRR